MTDPKTPLPVVLPNANDNWNTSEGAELLLVIPSISECVFRDLDVPCQNPTCEVC